VSAICGVFDHWSFVRDGKRCKLVVIDPVELLWLMIRANMTPCSQCNIAHIPLMEPHFGLAHADSPGASL